MKNVLLTGCSRGIGLAIAKHLCTRGYKVYGVSRTVPEYTHEAFSCIQGDITDAATLDKIEQKMSLVDVLIHNAGIGYFRPLENLREQEIRETLAVNLLAPLLLTRRLLPKLQKSKGNIISIGSISAFRGGKRGTAYCASKFGLRGFHEALFEECRKKEVQVSLVNPGMVNTPFFDDKDFAPEDNELCFIEPEDIAQVVADILQMRRGSVLKEIHVFPQKSSVVHKRILKEQE